MEGDAIVGVEMWPVDVPLRGEFVTSRGRISVAENVFVKMTLRSGTSGYGEMAPFAALTGESREASLHVARGAAERLIGQRVGSFRKLAGDIAALAPSNPAVRCGLETAILDAFCREARIPMWALWGGADVRPREIDITLPITTVERTAALAQDWYARGFRIFKTKVGTDVETDIRRLEAVHALGAGVRFVADANQGFTESEALHFCTEAARVGCEIMLLEQPVDRNDLASMAALTQWLRIPVVADESVFTLEDARAVIAENAANVINLKLMKTGVLESLEIASLAASAGLGLMIGGMVETRLAMGASLALALGRGGIEHLDLDTPLLMDGDPIEGGFRYAGATAEPWEGPGLDARPAETGAEPIRIE